MKKDKLNFLTSLILSALMLAVMMVLPAVPTQAQACPTGSSSCSFFVDQVQCKKSDECRGGGWSCIDYWGKCCEYQTGPCLPPDNPGWGWLQFCNEFCGSNPNWRGEK